MANSTKFKALNWPTNANRMKKKREHGRKINVTELMCERKHTLPNVTYRVDHIQ